MDKNKITLFQLDANTEDNLAAINNYLITAIEENKDALITIDSLEIKQLITPDRIIVSIINKDKKITEDTFSKKRLNALSKILSPIQKSEEAIIGLLRSGTLAKEYPSFVPIFLDFDILPTVKAGDKFVNIYDAKQVETDKVHDIVAIKGEVLLIDFWATWCGPCQKPMVHNAEMLRKSNHFNKKARIIGLGMEEKDDKIKQKIKDAKLQEVEHYYGFSFSEPIAKIYKINGIPCVALVDGEGTIVFKGHPMSVDLEALIKEMSENNGMLKTKIKDEPEQPKQDKPEDNSNNLIELKNIDKINEVLSNYSAKKKVLQLDYNMRLKTQIIKYGNLSTKEKSGLLNTKQCFIVDTRYRVEQTDLISSLKEELNKLCDGQVDKNTSCQFKSEVMQTTLLKAGTQCNFCKKEIKKLERHFINPVNNLHACMDCDKKYVGNLESEDYNPFDTHLWHEYNLVLLYKDSVVDSLKLGKNIRFKPEDYIDKMKYHNAYCDICSEDLFGDRYKCLGCMTGDSLDSIDVCSKCIGKEKEVHEKKADDHAMIRIPFNTGREY